MHLFSRFSRTRAILLPLLLGGISLLGACGAKENATTKLQITGSSTVAPLVTELAKAFEKSNPNVRIDVQTGGSSRGVLDAREGLVNIGMVSRALKDSEKDLLAHTIAQDGIALILHKDNTVQSLDNAQIVGIYTGKIKNWNEIGGQDGMITVVSKAEGRSTLELFLAYFKLKSSDIQAHTIIGDNEQGIKTVSGNPNAIGYVSIGAAQYSVTTGVPIKLMATNGVEASTEMVSNGQFPLARPLNLVTRTKPEGVTAEFIKFSQSEQVHQLIRQQYFVPLQH